MIMSPGWGTVLKKETLASHPLLKRRPVGEDRWCVSRASRALCARVPPERRREPVEPSRTGEEERLER